MKVIFFGAPGSGKGTQSELLCKFFNFYKLSPGDLLRKKMDKDVKFKEKVLSIVNNGLLVDDEIICDLVKDAVKLNNDILFDGFPRNIKQAFFLNKDNINVNYIIIIIISNYLILKRIKYRLYCTYSNKIFSLLTLKTKIRYKDDLTGSFLTKRSDDKYNIVINRLNVYKKNLDCLINFYSNKSLYLIYLNGNNNVFKIHFIIKKYLELYDAKEK